MYKTNTTVSYIKSFLVAKSTFMIIGLKSSHRRDYPSIALILMKRAKMGEIQTSVLKKWALGYMYLNQTKTAGN